jgi:Reverse transcriptase (RNA-dependent DNA polymerase)
MVSPFFFIKKKDRTLQPVQDYRRLNNLTIKNWYPLPLIQELVDKLWKARYFMKLDVCWGFNNVRIKEGDKWKAAFRTNRGLFEPLVMFFGLTSSPATFQMMMNSLFKEEINSGKVIIYMDDLLIFTETLEEHLTMVQQVLKKFADNKLFLKPEKCTFEADKVEYLGALVSKDRVCMDPAKVSAVKDWP